MKTITARRPAPGRIRALTTILGLTAGLLLTACSSGGSASSALSTSTSSPTVTTVHATTGTTIPFSLSKNARHDVTTAGPCTEVGGSWILHGDVTNSAKTARDYQIVVDIVSQPGDTVLDTKIVVTPRVPPGDKVPWSATSTPGLTGVACVIRQVQSPA